MSSLHLQDLFMCMQLYIQSILSFLTLLVHCLS